MADHKRAAGTLMLDAAPRRVARRGVGGCTISFQVFDIPAVVPLVPGDHALDHPPDAGVSFAIPPTIQRR